MTTNINILGKDAEIGTLESIITPESIIDHYERYYAIWDSEEMMPSTISKAAEFDVSVFNEIEVHNLDILAHLDTY